MNDQRPARLKPFPRVQRGAFSAACVQATVHGKALTTHLHIKDPVLQIAISLLAFKADGPVRPLRPVVKGSVPQIITFHSPRKQVSKGHQLPLAVVTKDRADELSCPLHLVEFEPGFQRSWFILQTWQPKFGWHEGEGGFSASRVQRAVSGVQCARG